MLWRRTSLQDVIAAIMECAIMESTSMWYLHCFLPSPCLDGRDVQIPISHQRRTWDHEWPWIHGGIISNLSLHLGPQASRLVESLELPLAWNGFLHVPYIFGTKGLVAWYIGNWRAWFQISRELKDEGLYINDRIRWSVKLVDWTNCMRHTMTPQKYSSSIQYSVYSVWFDIYIYTYM